MKNIVEVMISIIVKNNEAMDLTELCFIISYTIIYKKVQ